MELAIGELARFLGISQNEARKRVESYHPRQLGEDWNNAKHDTAEEVERFYSEGADKYLYELISWNYSETYFQRIEPLLHYHNQKILEIGAGIGSLCITLALGRNDVTYCDINETLFAFAKQRFSDRLLPIKMVKSLRELEDRDYDMVVAIDLLEHIHPDALGSLLKDIAGCLKDKGFLYHRSNFGQQDLFPMHYDHSGSIKELLRAAGFERRDNGDYVKGGSDIGVQISVPVAGGKHISALTHCLINLKTPPGTVFSKVDDTGVDHARNELAGRLTQSYLLFIDADQSFPPETLERLMSWNVDIVSGLAFRRRGEPVPLVYRYIGKQEDDNPNNKYSLGYYYNPMVGEIKEYLAPFAALLEKAPPAICLPTPRLIECDGVGAGCLLIHKRVFDALEKPYFQCSEGKASGEDFYFCRKAQLAGFKIYCDPSILCGHFGEYWRSHKHFMSFAMNKPFPWKDEIL